MHERVPRTKPSDDLQRHPGVRGFGISHLPDALDAGLAAASLELVDPEAVGGTECARALQAAAGGGPRAPREDPEREVVGVAALDAHLGKLAPALVVGRGDRVRARLRAELLVGA